MLNREKFIAEMPLREGANAIYIERPLIVYVRVSEIRCLEDRMEAQITVVHTPGMNEDCKPSFKISAVRDWFSNSYSQWHARHVSWTVYFGNEDLRIGLALAARAAEQGSVVILPEMRYALENSPNRRPNSSAPLKP